MTNSVEFEEGFSTQVSSCLGVCDCGITHFDAINQWDWRENEINDLENKAKQFPKEYMSWPHSIGFMQIAGMILVMGCPCNRAEKYENWIIAHAKEIAHFLNARSQRLKLEAQLSEIKVVL